MKVERYSLNRYESIGVSFSRLTQRNVLSLLEFRGIHIKKLIPDSKEYYITLSGVVTNKEGKVQNHYINGDGYVTVSIEHVSKGFVTYGLHRLKMLTFKPIENPELFTVNHIDKDKLNNDLPNLEWSSTGENNTHSAIFLNRFNLRPLIGSISESGVSGYYDDLLDAAESLGVLTETVWECVKTGNPLNGLRLFHITSKSSHVTKLRLSKQGMDAVPKRPCKVINLIDGQIDYYESVDSAARTLGFFKTVLHNAFSSTNDHRVFGGRYVVVNADENLDWLTDEVVVKLLSRGKKPVISLKVHTNVFERWESAAHFFKTNGLSKKAVTTSLKKENIRLINGFLFCYLSDEETDKNKLTEKANSLN